MPAPPDTCLDRLATTLRTHLSRPLRLDGDAARFVTATYGQVDANTLGDLLADTESSEVETLLEFLLFPDTALQLAIEPHLAALETETPLARELFRRLCEPPIDLQTEEGHRFPLPADFLQRFIVRLGVDRRLPTSLAAALECHLSGDDRLRARVLVRNGPAAMAAAAAELCARLVAALPSRHRDFWPALALAIDLGPEIDSAPGHAFDLLTAHKQRCFQLVEQQREFEHRLQRSNLETLLGQGQRVPTLARAEARKRMRVIDAICLALFGRTTYFQPAEFG